MDMLRADLLFPSLGALFLIGLTSFAVLIWYSLKKQEYWKKHGVPHVKPFPIVGSIVDIIWTPMQDVEYRRYFELGRIYGHFEGNRPVLSIGDAKLLREILVKDFHVFPERRFLATGDDIMDTNVSALTGEDWKRVRTIITPTFTTGKIKRMLGIFKDCSKSVEANFRQIAKKGEPADSKSIFAAYAMDVIASSAFSTKLDSHNDPENEFVLTAKKFFLRLSWRLVFMLMFPGVMKFFKISIFDPTLTNFFQNIVNQIIEERKSSGKTRNDFLQLLLDTAKANGEEQNEDERENADITSNYGEETTRLQGFKNISNKKLSKNELIAQCMVFFLAGFDAIANTLAFAAYQLALNPDIQDKLRAEVNEALKENDGELTYEAIQNMKYLDNVISETLRMYPAAVRLERRAVSDYKLGDTGITIPKGMIITIPLYAMHRDPKYFPEPEKFDPDRFTAEERIKHEQYSYLPFGAGPRNCIGVRFALVEVKVCLAHVIASFYINKHPRTKVPLEFHIGPGIVAPKEILLEYEPRNEVSSMA